MEMTKKVEFTKQEEEALNSIVAIWKGFYEECDPSGLCDDCIFSGICKCQDNLSSFDCVHVFKENMEKRL